MQNEIKFEREKKIVSDALAEFLKMLNQYNWTLPVKKLEIGDEDYYFYMCRANMGQLIVNHFSDILICNIVSSEKKQKIAQFEERIEQIYRQQGMRTEAEMEEVRKILESSVQLLEQV